MSETRARPLDVVAIGDLNPDLIFAGLDADRPSLGTEARAGRFLRTLGASAAICSVGLARLGASVALASRVGRDDAGDFCLAELAAAGVDTRHVRRSDASATGVTASIAYPADRLLVTHGGTLDEVSPEELPRARLAETRHLHATSIYLLPALAPGLAELFAAARAAGATTSLDTGWDPSGRFRQPPLAELLPQVDLLLPNRDELAAMSGTDTVADGIDWALDRGVGCVVVKTGADGAQARWADGRAAAHPGFAATVVDTTGAGDSFDAGFLYATLVGLAPERRLALANACGALACSGVGGTGGFVSLEQVQAFLTSAGARSRDLAALSGRPLPHHGSED